MSDEFTKHFFKYFIKKIAANLGETENCFTSVSEMALDIFADIAIYRLQKYAREIRQLIEYSGRTEPNGLDVFSVLSQYNETGRSLCGFLVEHGQPLEVQIDEYPIQQTSRHSQYMQGTDMLPFRANSTMEFDTSSSGPPLPHIPKFFQPQFNEEGILIDDDLDNGANSNLVRRQADSDVIVSVMKEQMNSPIQNDVPAININCPFIDQLISSIIDDTPQENNNHQQQMQENDQE
ncbi:hypothetical protein M9Y10_005521 [Tritrichomonas musculus]|uniref:Bromodomain associated domain-containing protein n=1 Tax=Tritrichomonas musculus TaxID=1915356 RepID=A0ABR2JC39_9EUKA